MNNTKNNQVARGVSLRRRDPWGAPTATPARGETALPVPMHGYVREIATAPSGWRVAAVIVLLAMLAPLAFLAALSISH